ncbi:MAG TPA: (2Fe-2S)-binding protein [Marinobacter sp.]|nr:(2Fe-2S)-binding protein [Marinobacter sp.]
MAATEAARDWLADYHRLLARHRLDPTTVLTDAVDQTAPQRPALLSLAQILEQPDRLHHQLTSEHPDSTEPRLRRARMSVLHQSLALQVIAPAVIRLFRDGVGTALDPERIFLCQPEADGGCRWREVAGSPDRLKPGRFIESLAHQVQTWYPVFRQSFSISPGAYWSSTGLALGAPYSAVWDRVTPSDLCPQASGWLQQFDCEAGKYIDWISARFNQHPCALPQRRGCCLKYLLPDEGYCGTCGVYRKERMTTVI